MTVIDLSQHSSASPACSRHACRKRISAVCERVCKFPYRAALRLALAASAVAAAYAFIALMRLRWFAWADHTFTEDPSYRPVPAGDRAPGDPGPQLRVPPILHHLWKNDDIFSLPELWQRSRTSCLGMHPHSLHGRDHYRHMMWTDEKMRELIAQKYPSHLSNYDAYPYHIQRVDAARYFILHQFGGIYLDLDIECRKPLDALRRDYAAVFPATLPFGVSNDFSALIETVSFRFLPFDLRSGFIFVALLIFGHTHSDGRTRPPISGAGH
jgi:hypothetical protein